MEELEEFLQQIHVPEDAEEYEEELKEILLTIEDGWGSWISCDKGWYPLIIKTHNKLKFIDPDYKIFQIKEKFGTLRYYYDSSFSSYSVEGSIMQDIITSAEIKSQQTCENCGSISKSELRENKGWLKTLCPLCSNELGYTIEEGEENAL